MFFYDLHRIQREEIYKNVEGNLLRVMDAFKSESAIN